MSTEIYRERFDNLLRVLRGVQSQHNDEGFNLLYWYSDKSLADHECATSACAVGWCCQDPWFQEQGLSLHTELVHDIENFYLSYPVFFGLQEWHAVRSFFGIDESTARFLFCEESYGESENDFVQVEEVIERVEMFVEDLFPNEENE